MKRLHALVVVVVHDRAVSIGSKCPEHPPDGSGPAGRCYHHLDMSKEGNRPLVAVWPVA